MLSVMSNGSDLKKSSQLKQEHLVSIILLSSTNLSRICCLTELEQALLFQEKESIQFILILALIKSAKQGCPEAVFVAVNQAFM